MSSLAKVHRRKFQSQQPCSLAPFLLIVRANQQYKGPTDLLLVLKSLMWLLSVVLFAMKFS